MSLSKIFDDMQETATDLSSRPRPQLPREQQVSSKSDTSCKASRTFDDTATKTQTSTSLMVSRNADVPALTMAAIDDAISKFIFLNLLFFFFR